MTDSQPIQILSKIPVNLITGFLGAGKTTLIRRLLANKPSHEKWAVLVNEFGEIGVDGALLGADGIAVKEVPGGCMCCTATLPSREALLELIRTHRPQRILIEPTGLALPQQVLQQFQRDEYRSLLSWQSVVCVIDPWSVRDDSFTQLPAFRHQIELADVLIASKMDQASEDDRNNFRGFSSRYAQHKRIVESTQLENTQTNIPWQWLTEPHEHTEGSQPTTGQPHHLNPVTSAEDATITPKKHVEDCERVEKSESFGYSCGWRFGDHWYFNEHALLTTLQALNIPRIKGVIQTSPQQWLIINRMRDTLSTEQLASQMAPTEAKLEMISMDPIDWALIEDQLLQTREMDRT